jgi:NADH dehydrogenase
VLRAAFADCDTVVNLVGILNEKGFSGRGFAHAHAELARKTVAAAAAAGVARLLHMSALGAAEDGPSFYLQSKGVAERHVRAAPSSLAWTIFRPSVIFGAGDSFMNRFAGLLRLSQGVIPLARAEARFAPIWVEDVAAASVAALDQRAPGGGPLPGGSSLGRSYDLCGPEVFTLGALVRLAGAASGTPARVIPLPDALARMQARVMDFVPGKPFSTDNYRSLTVDNVCREDGCAPLGITPCSLRALAPTYLRR